MKSHPKQLGVQMAATACLYNLSKGEVGAKVHPACLTRIVNLTLLAMENFPNHQQVSDRLSHWPWYMCKQNQSDYDHWCAGWKHFFCICELFY